MIASISTSARPRRPPFHSSHAASTATSGPEQRVSAQKPHHHVQRRVTQGEVNEVEQVYVQRVQPSHRSKSGGRVENLPRRIRLSFLAAVSGMGA